MEQSTFQIPVVTDVERNIDEINMIRCSYYSVQSDIPIPNWTLNVLDDSTPMLLLNLEAILVGPVQNVDKFSSVEDIDLMYDFVEKNEGLFVDINDVWIPTNWFGIKEIKQGLVYRISQENFSLCWKLRNDNISSEEFIYESKNIKEPFISFSEEETSVFQKWTKKQIQESQEIYQGNRTDYLQKIKQ
ncbi:MAG: hypothetical protein ACR2MT_06340 [Aurantibacter sp.]